MIPDDDLLAMLDELLDSEEGLSGWEMDFVESLNRQRGSGWTDKQADKLREIFERVCG